VPRLRTRIFKSQHSKAHVPADSFVLRYAELQIHETALKHGCSEPDIQHAYKNSTDIFELDQESFETKLLIIGPDSAGNLLEIIGLEKDDQNLLIIHAMKIRKSIIKIIERSS